MFDISKIPTPSESGIRKNYVPKVFDEKFEEVRRSLVLKKKWISVDETTDTAGRLVCNAIVGALEASSKTYLVNMEFREKVNHSTIARFILETVDKITSDRDEFLICITDGASYMKKAVEGLGTSMPKLIHVLCLAHNLHRVCEKIRADQPVIDELVSSLKKVFKKAPSRRALLLERAIPMPPQVFTTLWGIWLNSVFYLKTWFDDLESVVSEMDESGNRNISGLKNLLANPDLKLKLEDLHNRYGELPKLFESLQKRSLNVEAAISALEVQVKKFEPAIVEKMAAILEKNAGLHAILNKSVSPWNETEKKVAFDFGPVASTDVERSFSTYKQVFTDLRNRFTQENLFHHMFLTCNK